MYLWLLLFRNKHRARHAYTPWNRETVAVNYTRSNKTEVSVPFLGLRWNIEGSLISCPWRFLNQGIEQRKQNKGRWKSAMVNEARLMAAWENNKEKGSQSLAKTSTQKWEIASSFSTFQISLFLCPIKIAGLTSIFPFTESRKRQPLRLALHELKVLNSQSQMSWSVI